MKVEPVEDIPLLIAKFKEAGLNDLLDQHFKVHGNWEGPSFGTTTLVWLSYILSCGEHRLSPVEDWAGERLHTLQACVGTTDLQARHLSDDRLESILDYLSRAVDWDSFEGALNQRLLQVYQLSPPRGDQAVRLDTTLAQSFRRAEGLFQEGYAKQRRADLPQIKAMLSTMDPMALPLTVEVVGGDRADDPLYLPAIGKVQQSMPIEGLLFVGDKKMGSLETRAHVQGKGAYYLMPLSLTHCPEAQLLEYLAAQPATLLQIEEEGEAEGGGKRSLKARLFEVEQGVEQEHEGQKWQERRIVVHSSAWAQAQQAALDKRLAKAQAELGKLLQARQGKKLPASKTEVAAMAAQVLQKRQVEGFLTVEVEERQEPFTRRKYGKRPSETLVKVHWEIRCHLRHEAIEAHRELLGWRTYATNAPQDRLQPVQAVQCYWQEYRIEQRFNDLLNKVTALMPIFLHKENRIVALVRLLVLALKFSTLIQHQARGELDKTGQSIKELYLGNPGRKTQKPTTNLILGAFRGIALVFMELPDGSSLVQMTPLKPIQIKLLKLLGLSEVAYSNVSQFWKPESK
jgi:transposase